MIFENISEKLFIILLFNSGKLSREPLRFVKLTVIFLSFSLSSIISIRLHNLSTVPFPFKSLNSFIKSNTPNNLSFPLVKNEIKVSLSDSAKSLVLLL